MSNLTLQERYDFQVEANKSLVEACGKAMDLKDRAEAEIERLQDLHVSDQACIKECMAEIARLRAALQELASDAYHDDDYQVIARRALEGK